jgi:hypothetical protein
LGSPLCTKYKEPVLEQVSGRDWERECITRRTNEINVQMKRLKQQTGLIYLPSSLKLHFRNYGKCTLNKSKASFQKNAISTSDILNISWRTKVSLAWTNGKHIDIRKHLWMAGVMPEALLNIQAQGMQWAEGSHRTTVESLVLSLIMTNSGCHMCDPKQEQKE